MPVSRPNPILVLHAQSTNKKASGGAARGTFLAMTDLVNHCISMIRISRPPAFLVTSRKGIMEISQKLRPHPVYVPSTTVVLCLLQIFTQSIIEGFSFTYLGVFAGFITGTVVIVGSRLQNLSDSTSETPFPYDAFYVWGGFVVGSFLSGHYGTRVMSRRYQLSQMRSYQLNSSLGSIFLVMSAISTRFLKIHTNAVDIDSHAAYIVGLLLSIWSGFSFSCLKILQVPELPLPLCTNAVNTLFYEPPHHTEQRLSLTFKRMSLILVIFTGALTGAGTARGREWATMILSLFITGVTLCLAEYIERRRKKSDSAKEPESSSTSMNDDG